MQPSSGKSGTGNPTFDEFRQMANNASLSPYEKIGFPNAYRKDTEAFIFADIRSKLTQLEEEGKTVLDIGPGCSQLPQMLIDLCQEKQHQLLLVDSLEMLSLLPEQDFIQKIPGPFPNTPDLFSKYTGKIDCILTYSVLHHTFEAGNIWQFFDGMLKLLAPGGELLIGDIPNISKRKRFFDSENGVKYHQAFTQTTTLPEVVFNRLEPNYIDDGCIFGLMLRARSQGFDAYLLPQDKRLPMANRREDLLIRRP